MPKEFYGDCILPDHVLVTGGAGYIGAHACKALAQDVLANRPTAVIGTTDIAAIGAIHAAIGMGLAVPQDVSVIGFDDLPAARYVLPALTTVAQPLRQMAEQGRERLAQINVTTDQGSAAA